MIILVLFIALLLRLINLNQSLWLDEAVQAITAHGSFLNIFQEITADFHPPLFHFLMYFWVRIFGSSEVALRMPSLIFGIGTVYVVYLIIKRLTDSKINGLVGAILLATAPFHVYYSQEARMYSMVTFFTACSMYFFLKINELSNYCHPDSDGGIPFSLRKKGFLHALTIRSFGRNDNVLYFISTILMLYSDYYAFLVVLTQIIYIFYKKQFKFLITYCLLLVAFLPWIPSLITQLQTGALATKLLPGWGELVNLSFLKALPLTFVKFSIGRITIFNKIIYGIVSGTIGVVYGIMFIQYIKKWLKKGQKETKGIVLGWFFVPMIIAWLVSFVVPNYQPFRLLLVLPAFYLILYFGILNLKNKTFQILTLCFVLLVNLLSLITYYKNPYFYREDWRGVVNYVKENSSVAILPSDTSNWPIMYYDNSGKIKMIYGSNGISKINELQINELTDSKIYYVRYLVPLFDPNEFILAKLAEAGYTKVKEISFNQIPIWEYEKTINY